MERLYPKTIFSDKLTTEEQRDHVFEEMLEVLSAASLEEKDAEISDLEHSIQTYWDCRAKEGADIDKIRKATVRKNAGRGYYLD